MKPCVTVLRKQLAASPNALSAAKPSAEPAMVCPTAAAVAVITMSFTNSTLLIFGSLHWFHAAVNPARSMGTAAEAATLVRLATETPIRVAIPTVAATGKPKHMI